MILDPSNAEELHELLSTLSPEELTEEKLEGLERRWLALLNREHGDDFPLAGTLAIYSHARASYEKGPLSLENYRKLEGELTDYFTVALAAMRAVEAAKLREW